jgi:hypothetical protein
MYVSRRTGGGTLAFSIGFHGSTTFTVL